MSCTCQEKVLGQPSTGIHLIIFHLTIFALNLTIECELHHLKLTVIIDYVDIIPCAWVDRNCGSNKWKVISVEIKYINTQNINCHK
jgi:hypothetical protein